MKCALLSDIHANVEALRAVLAAAKKEGVERYLIAGDLMGYYYRLPEVMEALRPLKIDIIRGNHEDMYLEWENSPEGRPALEHKYGISFALNQENLSPADRALLKDLPVSLEIEIEGRQVLVCHGTPWDHDQYAYPDAPSEIVDRFFSYGKDIVIYGHTHYPVVWSRDGRIVVNPGSVGQPRDRKGGACWALWDTEEQRVTLRRESYDVEAVIADCERYNPDLAYMKNILSNPKE